MPRQFQRRQIQPGHDKSEQRLLLSDCSIDFRFLE